MTDKTEGQERAAALQRLRQVVESAVKPSLPGKEALVTPECPKGPENDPLGTVRVHPDDEPSSPVARRKVKLPITREPGAYWRDLTPAMATPPHVYSNEAIANWPVQALSDVAQALGHPLVADPEVERLTAEVALYRERDGLTRKALQHDGDGPLQFAALIVRQQRDKALAEVSRLTAEVEQLRKHGETQAAIIDGWVRYGRRTNDQKREWRAEVSRLREQLAAQTLLPDNAETLISLWLLDHNGTTYADYHETRPAARDLISFVLQWGVSSSEVEAPQPQEFREAAGNLNLSSEIKGNRHEVLIERRESMFYATCGLCLSGTQSHYQTFVEHWKDQHEADTLRPVGLTNESFISSQDEDERVPTLEALQAERRRYTRVEGRPSGSERLAPQPEPTFSVDDMFGADMEKYLAEQEAEALGSRLALAMDTLGAIWLYVNWRYVTGKLTTEQRELWADSVDDFGDPQDRGPKAERWWRDDAPAPAHDELLERLRTAMGKDAAQAARSEATPEDRCRDLRSVWQCSGCKGYFFALHHEVCPDCGREGYWSGSHAGNGQPGNRPPFAPVRKIPADSPSPSLRKEGEDA